MVYTVGRLNCWVAKVAGHECICNLEGFASSNTSKCRLLIQIQSLDKSHQCYKTSDWWESRLINKEPVHIGRTSCIARHSSFGNLHAGHHEHVKLSPSSSCSLTVCILPVTDGGFYGATWLSDFIQAHAIWVSGYKVPWPRSTTTYSAAWPRNRTTPLHRIIMSTMSTEIPQFIIGIPLSSRRSSRDRECLLSHPKGHASWQTMAIEREA